MFKKAKQFLFSNTSTKQTIAKNAFWLFVGEGGSRLLKMSIVIYAARVLGADGWGVFSYALSLAAIFMTFADTGLSTLVTRAASVHSEEKSGYLSAAMYLKFFLLIIGTILVIFAAPYFSSVPGATKLYLPLAGVLFFDSIREFFIALNRATERMERETFVRMFGNVVLSLVGFALLTKHPSVLNVSYAYLAGAIAGAIAISLFLKPIFKTLTRTLSRKLLRDIWSSLWPIVIISLFSTVLFNIDTYMLGMYTSAEEIGLYSAAQKLVQFSYILPGLLISAAFPFFSRISDDREKLRAIIRKASRLLLLVSIPVAAFGIIFSREIIQIFFGAGYAGATATAAILFLTVLSVFPNFAIVNTIFALNIQKKFISPIVIAAITNIVLNIALIPRLGIEGAAISITVSQTIITVLNIMRLKKYNGS